MIPQKDLDQLIQYYKGELMENPLLNKAATLAAKKKCLVSRSQTPSSHRPCQNQTSKSRIGQVNQTHTSISWWCGCRCTWWTSGRGRRGRRGFGDGYRGTMVEAHDKSQSVHPKPQITPLGPVKKGKAASISKIPVKKGTPSTSRGDSDLGSRLEAIRERRKTLEKKLASSPWAKGKGPGPLKTKAKAPLENWNS